MEKAGEQLLSEVVGKLFDQVPDLDVEELKGCVSGVLTKYHINRVEADEPHPDLKEKIEWYVSAKRVEGLSPKTIDGYIIELRLFSDHVKKKVNDISPSDIRAYLANNANVKKSTIGKKLACIKSFFGWLTSEEIIPRDPSFKIKSPKVEKLLPKALKIEEIEMLRESCQNNRQRAFLEVFYSTGARLSEIIELNIEDIDFVKFDAIVMGKGSKERKVFFSSKAMYHLKKYLSDRKDDCEALFVTIRKPYRRISARAIQDEFKKIADQAKPLGYDKNTYPHRLRHSFATISLNAGASLHSVQRMLGHSSADTTQRYAHLDEEQVRLEHKRYHIQ